ncbi:DeoR/GlpR family DNA-binding transcription regulator [Marinomonas sp. 15G1-11]|uniref:DeoR/GlpR family DNA-binding transcription regulator n=1 Tax=Marinomonas phaeophyticola TaxID=3004091 RepID=A0ABT4JW71_9GAMM|nr:DeoR/GlpR family DNA-binding transcription regulator [Marinomonas sp. 15G1-11]MCZ2722600.1 DeoR/GlpR family DNA-binding transcription regulator [Marinomonas sp. 15G1-11]
MSLSERQNQILNWVQQVDNLSIEVLVDKFDVSAQTIRKDVNQLADLHLVRRQHGGITQMSTAENLPFDNRQYLNGTAKQKIAHMLARDIPDGASVFLGIGTTVEYVAKELIHHKDLQVFTNNLMVAAIFSGSPHICVKMTGGRLRHLHRDLVGADALESIRQYYFDYGIIGCGGLDMSLGLLDFDPDEAILSRVILESSRCTVLVADQFKWGRKAMARVKAFSHLDKLYTDYVTPEQSALMAEHKVHLKVSEASVVSNNA